MKALFASCLLSTLSLASLASAPQYHPRQDIASGFKQLQGLAVADFNGDGKPDFAITDSDDKRVVVYLNAGNGSFSSPISTNLQFTAQGAYSIIAGDFNEDGKQDLIVSTIGFPLTDIFLSGTGDGAFTQQSNLPGSNGFAGGVAVDINHDSHLDFIAGEGGLYIYVGDGHGTFQLKNSPTDLNTLGNYTAVVAADFNKDQQIDFAASSWLGPSDLRSFLGKGDGTFSGPNSLSNPLIQNPFRLATADFNNDGNADLLLSSLDAVFVILGNGDGTFRLSPSDLHPVTFPNDHPPGGQNLPLVVAADADLDGKIDAIVANNASKTVNVVLNDGTGTFLQVNPDFSASIDAGTTLMQVADFNGDGLPDIIVTNYITQNISIFLSIKPKTFPAISLSSSSPSAFASSPISLTVKVAGSNSILPTGPITLMDGATLLGQQALDTNGQTIFTLSNLSVGVHPFTAVYAGDTNYTSVTSDFVSPIITDMHIASTTASQTVTAGAPASYGFTVIPDAGLTGAVTFTCSQLPSLATCDPLTVALNARPVDTTLTVRTAAPLHSKNSPSRYALALFPLFAVCCVRRRLLTPLLCITFICTLGFFVTGCSSSKSSTTTPGTPSGSTQFTVTASITSGGQTLTRTTTATLVVQ